MTEEVEPHILRRYDLVRKIGSGAYGHVWKVIDKRTQQVLALKKIFDAFQHATDAQRTYRQIVFLQEFDHENIIKLVNVIKAENDKDIYLVFEYMDIDLHSVIRENILKDKHKQYIIYQIAKAMKYLHTGELLHRDLKPSNVLINSECHVKLCDFGLVRSLVKTEAGCPIMTEYVATRWYRAPEILMGSHTYTKGVDIWSFGCMMGQLIKGKPLFPGTSTLNQIEKILCWTGMPTAADVQALETDAGFSMIENMKMIRQKNVREWLPNADDLAIDLISKMLQFNPKKRITIQEVLRHPYLKQFHNPATQPTSQPIHPSIDDNKKLSLKDYRNLIYKEVGRRFSTEKSRGQDISKTEIKCQLPSYDKAKKKSLKSVNREESEEDQDKQYGAKTVYVQKKKSSNTMYTSPMKPEKSSEQKKYELVRDRYLTEGKQSAGLSSASKGRNKIMSMYSSKKNSLKEYSHEKPVSIEQKKKSTSIYSAASGKKTPLLAKYLHKPVRLI